VARNRRARHDYDILETYECGLALQGSEVKSLRAGRVTLADAYARVEDGEAWLLGVHIPPYVHAAGFGAHDPERRRKLLLHRSRSTSSWADPAAGPHPRPSLHLLQRRPGQGRAGPGPGPPLYDKRHAIAERDADREAAREASRAAGKSVGRGASRERDD
jgi:SsrA-binding protein